MVLWHISSSYHAYFLSHEWDNGTPYHKKTETEKLTSEILRSCHEKTSSDLMITGKLWGKWNGGRLIWGGGCSSWINGTRQQKQFIWTEIPRVANHGKAWHLISSVYMTWISQTPSVPTHATPPKKKKISSKVSHKPFFVLSHSCTHMADKFSQSCTHTYMYISPCFPFAGSQKCPSRTESTRETCSCSQVWPLGYKGGASWHGEAR